MTDGEGVIEGLEQFKVDFKPFCGNSSDWARVDAAIELLKEQDERIKELELEKGWDESPDMMGKW